MPTLSEILQKYGKRHDSNDYKQSGYFGEIPLSNGNVATEYSVSQDIDGKNVEMPSIVPSLDYEELQAVKQSASTGSRLPDSVYEKALVHAKKRINNGQSPFWGIPEATYGAPEQNYLTRLILGYQ